MQVFHGQQYRLPCCQFLQDGQHHGDGQLLLLVRRDAGDWIACAERQREQLRQQGNRVARPGWTPRFQRSGQSLQLLFGRIAVRESNERLQGRLQRMQWRLAEFREAAQFQTGVGSIRQTLLERVQQPGLAHAGFAPHQHHLACAPRGLRPVRHERGYFGLATHQGRQPLCGVQSGACAAFPLHRE